MKSGSSEPALSQARRMAELGYRLFPLSKGNRKVPMLPGWQTTDHPWQDLERWIADGHGLGVALREG